MKQCTEWFSVGQTVNVLKGEDGQDMFNNDFTGTVKEINAEYVVVEDQDGDCWSVEPAQLMVNTDDIMHDS
jgi:hypothetical protein